MRLLALLIAFFSSVFSKSPIPQSLVSPTPTPYPLRISAMRQRDYPGSEITIEKSFPDGSNYHQYLTSYWSDGLKIYALLTVPMGDKPAGGWPVILFNHGYIAPQSYQTLPSVGQYATYFPVFSKNGYLVFKPDYRGNGKSEGQATSTYYSPDYTIDDLNALSSIKKYRDANPTKIGVWGHSMGGNITLRDLVINQTDIKAAVIWGGVVGSYDDLINNWQRRVHFTPPAQDMALRNKFRANLIATYGQPKDNPTFWNAIDPVFFTQDITAPVQLHVGGSDEEVPVDFSQQLYDQMKSENKAIEIYIYPGSNHNIAQGFNLAMQRTLAFFDKYLK